MDCGFPFSENGGLLDAVGGGETESVIVVDAVWWGEPFIGRIIYVSVVGRRICLAFTSLGVDAILRSDYCIPLAREEMGVYQN